MPRSSRRRVVGYVVDTTGRRRRRRILTHPTFRRVFDELVRENSLPTEAISQTETPEDPSLSAVNARSSRSYETRRDRCQKSWSSKRSAFFEAALEAIGVFGPSCTFCDSPAEFRCLDCGISILFCKDHVVMMHRGKFHVPEKWKDGSFQPCYIEQPVFVINEGHECTNQTVRPITVVDVKGRHHTVHVQFCSCRSDGETLILLHLWPATADRPVIAFQFQLMEWMRILFLECKVALRNICQALSCLSPSKLQKRVKCIYSVLSADSFAEYRYLMHQIQTAYDRPGTSVACPSCPTMNGNRFISFDAIFGLKRWKKSGSSLHLPRHHNSGFFIDQANVDKFVESYKNSSGSRKKAPENECSNFQAGDNLHSKVKSSQVDETGLFGSVCRHEMPVKFFNLRKGESLSNAVFLIKYLLQPEGPKLHVLYDIACTLKAHLKIRDARSEEKLLPLIKLAVPVFHVYAHKPDCQMRLSPRRLKDFGLNDGEQVERLWSYLRNFAPITKEMTASNRVDALTDALFHHMTQRKKKLVNLLSLRYDKTMASLEAATKELADITTAKEGQSSGISEEMIRQWMCEEEAFTLPATVSGIDMSNREMYALKLRTLQTLQQELTSSTDEGMSSSHLEVLSRKVRKIDAELKVMEQGSPRWSFSSLAYTEAIKLNDDRHRASSLTTLHNMTVDRWFLLALKRRYADGQAIAQRLCMQINSVCKKMKGQVSSYNSMVFTSDPAPYPLSIDYKEICCLESPVWQCLQTVMPTQHHIPKHVRRQIADVLHRVDRCKEEVLYLTQDMNNLHASISNQLKYLEDKLKEGGSGMTAGCLAHLNEKRSNLIEHLIECHQFFSGKIPLPEDDLVPLNVEVISLDGSSVDLPPPEDTETSSASEFEVLEDILGPVDECGTEDDMEEN